jgi:hypothetical protein
MNTPLGPMRVTYSHAAPYVRAALCLAAHEVTTAQTINARNYQLGRVDGLAAALRILVAAEDARDEPGIADVDTLPPGAVAAARKYLGIVTASRLIGPVG